MAFSDLLVFLDSYPEPVPCTAVDMSIDIARALAGKLSALSFSIRLTLPGRVMALTDRLIDIPAMVADEHRRSTASGRSLLQHFSERARARGVFNRAIFEQETSSSAHRRMVEHARLHDLTILPVRENQDPTASYGESLLFGAGRPVIVFPAELPRQASLETVIVAWDFSRAATRALADAMPIIKRANHVRIVTVTGDKPLASALTHADLQRHLQTHEIDARIDLIEARGRPAAVAIASHVASCSAGLLVMGAYGHSRLREFVLGGVTRSMMRSPNFPVFMSH